MKTLFGLSLVLLCSGFAAAATQPASAAGASNPQACFLLFEIGVGEVRRAPAEACRIRLSPASTFKIPHALAGVDSGVLAGPDHELTYDGRQHSFEAWRRNHTLASAMHHSVVWYFQTLAEQLGVQRESAYLERLEYGNRDVSSGLKIFWLGQSLEITPEEQLAFLVKLYSDELRVSRKSMDDVRQILIQPRDNVIDARGAQPFLAPWPKGVVVSAKTGRANDRTGRGIRWLMGHVKRADRSYVFVSCVVGTRDVEANAAIDLAAKALREQQVL